MAVIAVIMSVNFAACSDDDEKAANPIIGTWKVIEESDSDSHDIEDKYTFYDNGTVLNEYSYTSGNELHKESDIYKYELNSDNTILSIDYGDGDGYEKMRIEITDNTLMKWTYINYEGEYTILKKIK